MEDKKKIQCELCGSWFVSKDLLDRHIRRTHMEGKLPCPHCDMEIKSKDGLRNHILLKHENRKRFKCVDCNKLFFNNFQLQVSKEFFLLFFCLS